jgi:hypothetical protein
MVSRPHRGRFPLRFTDCRSYLEGAGRADSWVLNNLNGLPVDVARLLAAWLLFDHIENVVEHCASKQAMWSSRRTPDVAEVSDRDYLRFVRTTCVAFVVGTCSAHSSPSLGASNGGEKVPPGAKEGRVATPPPFPVVVRPGSSGGPEHVSAHVPHSDVGEFVTACRGELSRERPSR